MALDGADWEILLVVVCDTALVNIWGEWLPEWEFVTPSKSTNQHFLTLSMSTSRNIFILIITFMVHTISLTNITNIRIFSRRSHCQNICLGLITGERWRFLRFWGGGADGIKWLYFACAQGIVEKWGCFVVLLDSLFYFINCLHIFFLLTLKLKWHSSFHFEPRSLLTRTSSLHTFNTISDTAKILILSLFHLLTIPGLIFPNIIDNLNVGNFPVLERFALTSSHLLGGFFILLFGFAELEEYWVNCLRDLFLFFAVLALGALSW